jgi:hypothetical protein
MKTRDIARDAWNETLAAFTRQHEGWLVSVKTRDAEGATATAARDMPLQGVSPASSRSSDLAIAVGARGDHLTHEVHAATALQLEFTDEEAERALIIHSEDGSTTTIEFRSPMRPEEVDGLPTVRVH